MALASLMEGISSLSTGSLAGLMGNIIGLFGGRGLADLALKRALDCVYGKILDR